jgi:hypothetical protein
MMRNDCQSIRWTDQLTDFRKENRKINRLTVFELTDLTNRHP